MTLVVGGTSSKAIWLMTDRRISFRLPTPPKDDATKVFDLRAKDGVMLIGYAGLGLTAGGTEPSEWMLRTLRNLGVTVEQAMQVLTAAIQTHLAPHLKGLAWTGQNVSHAMLALAFVNKKPRAYTIGLFVDPNTSEPRFSGHWQHDDRAAVAPVHAFAGGSGRRHVRQRELRTLFKEHARGRLTAQAVAERLAAINLEVHGREKTVGDRCIVTYREREGGGQSFYFTGTERDRNQPGIPALSNGTDMRALFSGMIEAQMKRMQAHSEELQLALKEKRSPEEIKAIWEKVMPVDDFKNRLTENVRKMPKGPDPSLK